MPEPWSHGPKSGITRIASTTPATRAPPSASMRPVAAGDVAAQAAPRGRSRRAAPPASPAGGRARAAPVNAHPHEEAVLVDRAAAFRARRAPRIAARRRCRSRPGCRARPSARSPAARARAAPCADSAGRRCSSARSGSPCSTSSEHGGDSSMPMNRCTDSSRPWMRMIVTPITASRTSRVAPATVVRRSLPVVPPPVSRPARVLARASAGAKRRLRRSLPCHRVCESRLRTA